MATFEETQAAKEILEQTLFADNPSCNGCGITKDDLKSKDDNDWLIIVMFESEEARDAAALDEDINGVPVKTKVVGKIVAY